MPDFSKTWRPTRSIEADGHLTERVDELRAALQLLDPETVAARSGISYRTGGPRRGEWQIPFWGKTCLLGWPALTGRDNNAQSLSDFQLAFLFYYLLTADGTPPTGKWVSFAELPNGRLYNSAFQGYSGDEVAKTFALNLDSFHAACLSAGGLKSDPASASFRFRPLPRVPLMITYWLGDEDFPSSCKILFDETACHYLPIDACAILGSMLSQKLIHLQFG